MDIEQDSLSTYDLLFSTKDAQLDYLRELLVKSIEVNETKIGTTQKFSAFLAALSACSDELAVSVLAFIEENLAHFAAKESRSLLIPIIFAITRREEMVNLFLKIKFASKRV